MINKKAAILDILPTRRIQLHFIFLTQYCKRFHPGSIWILIFVLMALIPYGQGCSKVFITFISFLIIFASLCTWTAVYIVHNLSNTLDDCHSLEKTTDFCNAKYCNDVVVSIKVQNFRSRYAKDLYI